MQAYQQTYQHGAKPTYMTMGLGISTRKVRPLPAIRGRHSTLFRTRERNLGKLTGTFARGLPRLTSDRRRRLVIACVSLYDTLDAVLKMDKVPKSISRRFAAYVRLGVKKYKLQNARNKSTAVLAVCLAIVDLLGMVGITVDVEHVKFALSDELQTMLRLFRGNSDVDLMPLILALIGKLSEPTIEQIRKKMKSPIMALVNKTNSSASQNWWKSSLCDQLCGDRKK